MRRLQGHERKVEKKNGGSTKNVPRFEYSDETIYHRRSKGERESGAYQNYQISWLAGNFIDLKSSCGGLEVELWTGNSLPSASVDQIPLGAVYLYGNIWTRYNTKSTDMCYNKQTLDLLVLFYQ